MLARIFNGGSAERRGNKKKRENCLYGRAGQNLCSFFLWLSQEWEKLKAVQFFQNCKTRAWCSKTSSIWNIQNAKR